MTIGVGGGQPASFNQSLEIAIGHPRDRRTRCAAHPVAELPLPAENADRDIVHTLPVGYYVGRTLESASRAACMASGC